LTLTITHGRTVVAMTIRTRALDIKDGALLRVSHDSTPTNIRKRYPNNGDPARGSENHLSLHGSQSIADQSVEHDVGESACWPVCIRASNPRARRWLSLTIMNPRRVRTTCSGDRSGNAELPRQKSRPPRR
jgi:hypothetical protein